MDSDRPILQMKTANVGSANLDITRSNTKSQYYGNKNQLSSDIEQQDV